jgi:hypothetical protein
MMVVADVAAVLLDVVRTLLEKPGVHIPTVKIEPPGGALTLRPTPEVVAQAYASAPGPKNPTS